MARWPGIESTVRYRGVEVDDALEIAEKIDVCSAGQSCRALPVTLSGGFGPGRDVRMPPSAQDCSGRSPDLSFELAMTRSSRELSLVL
jgi:hypothetical protein